VLKTLKNILGKKDTITTSRELALSLGLIGLDSSSGQPVNAATALNQSTVYSCIRVLTQTISSLPVHIIRSDGETREKVDNHSCRNILSLKPNAWQTAQQFWAMQIGHLQLRGNAYALIDRRPGGNEIRSLIPLNPDSVSVEQNDDGTLTYKHRVNGQSVVYSQEQIFHLKGLALDGVRGLSPIEAQRDSIGLAKAQESHGAALFRNGATPSGVFHTDSTLSDEGYDRLKENLETYRGAANAHQTVILEDGLSWQQLSMTSEDSQWLGSRAFQAHEICGIYGIPPWKVGLMDKATFNNTEQMQLHFVQESVTPWLVNMEQTASTQLLTRSELEQGYRVKLSVEGLLRGDVKTRFEAYRLGIDMGVYSPNEVRSLENLNPVDGGDTRRQ